MKKTLSVIRAILIWLITTLLLLAAGAAVFFYLIYHGPSVHYRERFVRQAIADGREELLVHPFISDEDLTQLLKGDAQ